MVILYICKMKSLLRIKEILKEKRISTKDFASKAGLSYTYCTELIRGDKFPRQNTLIKISLTLDVDLRDLFVSTKQNNLKPIYEKDEKGHHIVIGYLKKDRLLLK